MSKSKRTYKELKLLRETLRQERLQNTFVKKVPMESEQVLGMVHYVKQGFVLVWECLKFLVFTMWLVLGIGMGFLSLLMVVFVIYLWL